MDPRSVHAYVVGEHGDSEVPVWSSATVGGMAVGDFCREYAIPYDAAVRERIGRETREAAYEIIARKGSTYYAVAAGLLRIVEAIVRDQATVLSVSTRVRGPYGLDGVCLSLPTVVARDGATRPLELALSHDEEAALRHSASVLAATAAELEDRPD